MASKITQEINNALRKSISDVIRGYINAINSGTTQTYINEVCARIREESRKNSEEENIGIVQQLIFLNLVGCDTTWADFIVLGVMSLDDFSAKRLAYTAAAQMWNTNSDVVLMATNRIQKDLTSNLPLLTSVVLTSLPPYLTDTLALSISQNVISLMTSTRANIRQKAIMTFYHICLKYPDALKMGFATLRKALDSDDISVVFSALSVINELCAHNPSNFIPLIPKIFKMIDVSADNWVLLRIINILRMLCEVEPRLPKKLITPFTNILETTSSVTVLFETVRTIIEVPITNTVLLTYAAQKMQMFLEHQDVNLRYLCLSLFIKLMQIQPKLVAQHKDLITQCLDSEDESTRMMALNLLSALANPKTVDGIVAKMFDHFKESKNITFKNQIVTRVVEICSKSDYALIQDFDWYISVLMDFVNDGGISCFDLIADQFLDLALRVPSTRQRLVSEMSTLFDDSRYKDENRLLLAASHIIGDYSENTEPFEQVLSPVISQMTERVQTSCITTAFKLYLQCEKDEEKNNLETIFNEKAEIFSSSKFAEVQDMASLAVSIISIMKEDTSNEAFNELRSKLEYVDEEDEPEPIPIPEELNEPVELFSELKNEIATEIIDDSQENIDKIISNTTTNTGKVRKIKKRIPRQQQSTGAPVVILKSHEKLLPTSKQTTTSRSSLSDALSSIDLSQTVAETEARISKPQHIPFDQSLQLKKKALEEAAAKEKAANKPVKKVIRKRKVVSKKPQPKDDEKNQVNTNPQQEEKQTTD